MKIGHREKFKKPYIFSQSLTLIIFYETRWKNKPLLGSLFVLMDSAFTDIQGTLFLLFLIQIDKYDRHSKLATNVLLFSYCLANKNEGEQKREKETLTVSVDLIIFLCCK